MCYIAGMPTITIPKELAKKGDLVVVPRKEYEEFLRLKKQRAFLKLDKDLQEALRQVARGEILGPFRSAKELKKALEK